MNIIAIRQGAIGDSILSFSVLSTLRAKFADAGVSVHLTFVGHPAVLPLVRAWGIAEEVHNFEERQWDELFSEEGIRNTTIQAIFPQADLVICWVQDRHGLVKPNLLKVGAKEVIIGPWCGSEHSSKHAVEYLAEPLGLSPFDTSFTINAPGWSRGFCAFDAPIAIHPGCSMLERRWPARSFATVINQLLRLQHPVLLLAGPSEIEQLKEVQKRLQTPKHTRLLTVLQNVPLLEVARQLKQCKYYLGNDSGVGHIAGILGIPTLILFGPSSSIALPPHVMHPLGPRVEVIQEQRLDQLSPERVLNCMLRKL